MLMYFCVFADRACSCSGPRRGRTVRRLGPARDRLARSDRGEVAVEHAGDVAVRLGVGPLVHDLGEGVGVLGGLGLKLEAGRRLAAGPEPVRAILEHQEVVDASLLGDEVDRGVDGVEILRGGDGLLVECLGLGFALGSLQLGRDGTHQGRRGQVGLLLAEVAIAGQGTVEVFGRERRGLVDLPARRRSSRRVAEARVDSGAARGAS